MKLEWTIWWWQFGCRDAWTPELTDKFGWSVKSKSIQEELCPRICVGSCINWEKPFEDDDEKSFKLSVAIQDTQEKSLTLLFYVTGIELILLLADKWEVCKECEKEA